MQSKALCKVQRMSSNSLWKKYQISSTYKNIIVSRLHESIDSWFINYKGVLSRIEELIKDFQMGGFLDSEKLAFMSQFYARVYCYEKLRLNAISVYERIYKESSSIYCNRRRLTLSERDFLLDFLDNASTNTNLKIHFYLKQVYSMMKFPNIERKIGNFPLSSLKFFKPEIPMYQRNKLIVLTGIKFELQLHNHVKVYFIDDEGNAINTRFVLLK